MDRKETKAFFASGWLIVLVELVLVVAIGLLAWNGVYASGFGVGLLVVLPVVTLILPLGFIVLQPNEAVVITFFGQYTGSIRNAGFWWYNPLSTTKRVSLRVYNWSTPTLKVNDLEGNPIDVGAIVVWQVEDTARAVFEVQDYENFLQIQSESALRQLTGSRPYDKEDHADTLRGDVDVVAKALKQSIQTHVELAGILILEAKLAHLAYAPEIASVMLRRQQATAVIAARSKIVKGAVLMVEDALKQLEEQKIVALDAADKARLVTNLMTVLVGESSAQPVIQMSDTRS
jgi:regulator of protease activity HflC (stomatin/prohibitin superfamily)